MIISASRRTDIPAFYGDWFYNRLLAGEVLIRNPMNVKNVSRILLSPETIECIVFWTKNPADFLRYISPITELGYNFYFQYTLTSYDQQIELNVPKKTEITETFQRLSDEIGRNRVIWRYDPVFINEKYTVEYHSHWFDVLCEKLSPYTNKCVVSFYDEYPFLKNKTQSLKIAPPSDVEIQELAHAFSNSAKTRNIDLSSCCEKVDLSTFGITHNKCIDGELIQEISSKNIDYKKDPSQRESCGCIASRDIGVYSTCNHGCVYCYAERGRAKKLNTQYDPVSPLLCDTLLGDEIITTVKNAPLNISRSHQENIGI
jgi:hypothetical protein